MKNLLALAGCALFSAACAPAAAAQIDPENDLHCAALAVGFRIAGEQQGAPKDQMQAIAFIDAHFSKKLRAAAVASKNPDALLSSLKPIVTLVEADLLATKGQMMKCVGRAIKESGLDR